MAQSLKEGKQVPKIHVTTDEGQVVWSEDVSDLDLTSKHAQAMFIDEMDIALTQARRYETEREEARQQVQEN